MEWSFRKEILEITHRWPVIVTYVLAGCLIGGLIAYLLPAPYQAERSLLVTYNADITPRNPDDYKNWQMEQLNAFILSEEVLQETLRRLQEGDSTWSSTSLEELSSRLHVYWRNAGEWRLVADAPSAALAGQLAGAWAQTSLDLLEGAREASLTTLELSTRLDAIANQLVQNKMERAALEKIEQELIAWQAAQAGSPADLPLETAARWTLLAQVSRGVEWDPTSLALLQAAPAEDAPASAYLPWVEQAILVVQQKLSLLKAQSDQLQAEYDQLYAQWSVQQEDSGGLTAYILVQPDGSPGSGAKQERIPGLMAFIGGLLGLLVWGLVYLAAPIYRRKGRTA